MAKPSFRLVWGRLRRAYLKIIFLAAIWDVFNAFKTSCLGTTWVWDAEAQAGSPSAPLSLRVVLAWATAEQAAQVGVAGDGALPACHAGVS